MSMTIRREVVLEDFIMPQFRGKNPKDYEFRDDGKIVRKDRWENGIHKIHNLLVENSFMPDEPEFEISDVVDAVNLLIEKNKETEND